MPFEWSRRIARYFDRAAPAYGHSIDPVFGALAQSLVVSAQIRSTDVVLDLGTGTGLVSEAASRFTSQVVGIDFSLSMLDLAQHRAQALLICGDIHAMPLASNSFDLVLASFAYNSTDPTTAFAETRRVLHNSGRLIMQEWAATDEISDVVSDLFAEYMVDDPPPELARLREEMQEPIPWDDLETIEALGEALVNSGFKSVEVTDLSPEIVLPDAEAFLQYKLAWPIRAAELLVMPDDIRALCLSDLRENIAPYIKRSTGQLVWQPNIVRISAIK